MFGFHQIPMSREDEEHIAFITVDGLFCYVCMPYGLKNALPTFVRVMHKTFSDLIRDSVEVYVDDIVAKIKSRASLLNNLALVFDRLRSTHTKLNPDKCVFEVTIGKLLGFLFSCRGIEANPEKIKMIKAMRSPARIKDVQKLTGCLVVLSRFISRLAEWALPFFKLLQKFRPFVWTVEAEEVFQELKQYLTSPPIMVAPEVGEPLLLYIVVTTEAVSVVLVAERPEPHQHREIRGTSASSYGPQDPEPVEGARVEEADGSQNLGPSPAPVSQVGSHVDIGSQLPAATVGSGNQEATRSQNPNALSDVGGQEPLEPGPMEVDAPDPSRGSGPSSARCTTLVKCSMMPRQGTWKDISYFKWFSLLPGSCVTTSRLTRSQWWHRIH
jgi:hypothetical protein